MFFLFWSRAVTLTNAGIALTVLIGVVWLRGHAGWRQRVTGAALTVAGLIVIGTVS